MSKGQNIVALHRNCPHRKLVLTTGTQRLQSRVASLFARNRNDITDHGNRFVSLFSTFCRRDCKAACVVGHSFCPAFCCDSDAGLGCPRAIFFRCDGMYRNCPELSPDLPSLRRTIDFSSKSSAGGFPPTKSNQTEKSKW